MKDRSVSSRKACAFGLAGLLGALAIASTSAADDIADRIGTELKSVFERSHPAVVKIAATDEHGALSGTGFFVDPVGTLYTAYSVGGEADGITVTMGDRRYTAKRLIADARSGIAILKVEATKTPFLPLGRSETLEPSTPVMTVGYPMDLPVACNFGLVAGFDIKHQGKFFSTRHIRANVAVQRGQGGAPLLNLRGEVVGILISSLDNGAGCFALPIEAAEKVRANYVRFGDIRHGWIGVVVEPAPVSEAGSIARVAQMASGTAAEAAGLQEGDVLLRVGRTKIQFPEDVFEASFFLTAGDQVPVTVWRHGRTIDLELTPQEHPANSRVQAVQVVPGLPLGMDQPN